jgi:hypothetical protein
LAIFSADGGHSWQPAVSCTSSDLYDLSIDRTGAISAPAFGKAHLPGLGLINHKTVTLDYPSCDQPGLGKPLSVH